MAKYKKNFITNVIFKIDFPTILKIREGVPTVFQSKIISTFPILRELDELKVDFAVSSASESNKSSMSVGSKIWQFHNKEKTKSVALSCNYLALEYSNYYVSFDEFITDVVQILDAFSEEYDTEIIDRIGLRYLNQIKINSGNPLDWKDLINDELTSAIRFPDTKNLMRIMQEIQIKESDHQLTFRYGIVNSMYPSNIVRKEFLLDIDCFSVGETSREEIKTLLEKYHISVKEIFEKSIGKDLRKIMENPKDE